MRMIDLCCGIGGIRRGFELAGGFKNVMSAEVDKYACETYKHLFGDDANNDVKDDAFKKVLRQTDYDVLLAGFPCQAFSRIGLLKGFQDTTKGTIFFEIAQIIQQTMPKVVFLENVENLVRHDKGRTFEIIINALEKELNYHVVGVNHDNDELTYEKSSFIRNTKNFGLPQNRPSVYIIAFSRDYYGEHLKDIPNELPKKGTKQIYRDLTEILESDVSAQFFMSAGYLRTLENHKARQKANGNGFGYRIVNERGNKKPIANTILATGGSGKERNLVYDPQNGLKYAGRMIAPKKTVINNKFIRTMTPTEWGKLQGFIGYGFMDENGIDHFSFPEKMSNQQKFKQFGNSVSIPVIEEMAVFIKQCVNLMTKDFSEKEKEQYKIPGAQKVIILKAQEWKKNNAKNLKIEKYYDLVKTVGVAREFAAEKVSKQLNISLVSAYKILKNMEKMNCISHEHGKYELEYVGEKLDAFMQ